ncbi:bifunctional riboflavin kinase/FAD synthetase [Maritalea sp.]|uniref:bifunctional riboflavin kinase/FAD synthetase n=1 Tax=Maritalea sp. TaxID=2003361 RepID=UPI003EF49386
MAFSIIEDLSQFPAHLRGATIAIGNFDGCHLGHQSVFEAARNKAKALGKPALVLTFEPHPRDVFAEKPFMFRLTERDQKARLVEALGFDGIVVLPFTKDLAGKTAEEFVADFLVDSIGVSAVAVGADFHFGRKRAGTPDFLAKSGQDHGFEVKICQMLDDHQIPVSSSRVRDALRDGDVPLANSLLGYHFFITGEVSHGDKRGRELGYPTANISLSPFEGLKLGVYAVRVLHNGKRYDGVAAYGRRPMFDNGKALFETHIFGFSGEIYGDKLEVAMTKYLRGEKNFDGIDELIAAMDQDSIEAKANLANEQAISLLDDALGFFSAPRA